MHFLTDKGADMSAARDVGEQAARGAIPIATSIVTWLALIPLDRVLLLLTVFYTALQIYVLVRDRIYKPWRSNRDITNAQPPSAPNGTSGQT